MPQNNKGRASVKAATPSKTTSDSQDCIKNDPLIAWFNLAKPARNRQQKRGWQKGRR
jgi:hypothetical protein